MSTLGEAIVEAKKVEIQFQVLAEAEERHHTGKLDSVEKWLKRENIPQDLVEIVMKDLRSLVKNLADSRKAIKKLMRERGELYVKLHIARNG